METSLHRQLKAIYAANENADATADAATTEIDLADVGTQTEVTWGRYRIDVVRDGELIEIQHGSLAAIRDKIRHLLSGNRVRVVKPIVRRKRLVKRAARGRRVVGHRMSPKQGTVLDLFHEMVYFCRVFPHSNLTLETPLVTVEEWRFPGHGRRRRRRSRDHQVEDQKLVSIDSTHRFRTAADLAALLPGSLPVKFDTQMMAQGLQVDRGFAQRIAYSLRHIGGIREVGKRGNARLYERTCV